MTRKTSMAEECAEHFSGPGLVKRRQPGTEKYPTNRKRWPYMPNKGRLCR